jgi:hypothetical protein
MNIRACCIEADGTSGGDGRLRYLKIPTDRRE